MSKAKNELIEIIRNAVEKVVINSEEDYDRPLAEIGIYSLDLMAVLLEVEEKYNINISNADVDGFVTINLISAYIESKVDRPDAPPKLCKGENSFFAV